MSVRPAILSEDQDGPILFYHSQSFYCQKVGIETKSLKSYDPKTSYHVQLILPFSIAGPVCPARQRSPFLSV